MPMIMNWFFSSFLIIFIIILISLNHIRNNDNQDTKIENKTKKTKILVSPSKTKINNILSSSFLNLAIPNNTPKPSEKKKSLENSIPVNLDSILETPIPYRKRKRIRDINDVTQATKRKKKSNQIDSSTKEKKSNDQTRLSKGTQERYTNVKKKDLEDITEKKSKTILSIPSQKFQSFHDLPALISSDESTSSHKKRNGDENHAGNKDNQSKERQKKAKIDLTSQDFEFNFLYQNRDETTNQNQNNVDLTESVSDTLYTEIDKTPSNACSTQNQTNLNIENHDNNSIFELKHLSIEMIPNDLQKIDQPNADCESSIYEKIVILKNETFNFLTNELKNTSIVYRTILADFDKKIHFVKQNDFFLQNNDKKNQTSQYYNLIDELKGINCKDQFGLSVNLFDRLNTIICDHLDKNEISYIILVKSFLLIEVNLDKKLLGEIIEKCTHYFRELIQIICKDNNSNVHFFIPELMSFILFYDNVIGKKKNAVFLQESCVYIGVLLFFESCTDRIQKINFTYKKIYDTDGISSFKTNVYNFLHQKIEIQLIFLHLIFPFIETDLISLYLEKIVSETLFLLYVLHQRYDLHIESSIYEKIFLSRFFFIFFLNTKKGLKKNEKIINYKLLMQNTLSDCSTHFCTINRLKSLKTILLFLQQKNFFNCNIEIKSFSLLNKALEDMQKEYKASCFEKGNEVINFEVEETYNDFLLYFILKEDDNILIGENTIKEKKKFINQFWKLSLKLSEKFYESLHGFFSKKK